MLLLLNIIFLSFALAVQQVTGLPANFVDEPMALFSRPMKAIFAPNPRIVNGPPMMIVSTKDGGIFAMEDPDNSDRYVQLADLGPLLCTNGPRGVFTALPDPDFLSNKYLYVWYTRYVVDCPSHPTLGPRNRLSRFTLDVATFQLLMNSEVVLLETPPSTALLHDGGGMHISPADRHVYMTIGDGGTRAYAQDLRKLYGKVVRLNLDGSVPLDNPFTLNGTNCRSNGGVPAANASSEALCEEIFAYGLRSPFRLGADPNTVDKVLFAIAEVGNSGWEEANLGGTDFKGANYGYPLFEGPCVIQSTSNCPAPPSGITEPFFYYRHIEPGSAITASVFVPKGLWPTEHTYMYSEFVFGKIVHIIRDDSVGCRTCKPPRPYYREETFHSYGRVIDIFFGPYQDTQAMYYISHTSIGERVPNLRRIRYVGGEVNQQPLAVIYLVKTEYEVNETISLVGDRSTDPDNSTLEFLWDFGDNRTSTITNPEISYSTKGTKNIKLTVKDLQGAESVAFERLSIGAIPTATMISPAINTLFSVGEVLVLEGIGTDLSTNTPIPDSQMFWEVMIQHSTHFHPFMQYQSGNNIRVEPAPSPEDFAAASTSSLIVSLTVVDSNGVSNTITRSILPRTTFIDIDSNPRGLDILIGDATVVTPATITTWHNQKLRLEASSQGRYTFQSWNIGGASLQTIQVPLQSEPNLKIVADFMLAATDAPVAAPIMMNCPSVATFELYDALSQTKVVVLTNGTFVGNPPLCDYPSVKIIPCVPYKVNVTTELYNELSVLVRRRVDLNPPYFLFSHSDTEFIGGKMPKGIYRIRAFVDGVVTPLMTFEMGTCAKLGSPIAVSPNVPAPTKLPTTLTKAPTSSEAPTSNCTIASFDLYNALSQTKVVALTNGTYVANPPPCDYPSVKIIPCVPYKVSVTTELYNELSVLVRRRVDLNPPYFLFSHSDTEFKGGKMPKGIYRIRAFVNGIVTPLLTFEMGTCSNLP